MTDAVALAVCSIKRTDHMGLLSPVSVVPAYGELKYVGGYDVYAFGCHINDVDTIANKLSITANTVECRFIDTTASPPRTAAANTLTDKNLQGN
jgi:hypothetical protein